MSRILAGLVLFAASSAPTGAQLALPDPTGLFPIGTVVWMPSEENAHAPALPAAAQLFYPAATPSPSKAAYLLDTGLLDAFIASTYYRQDLETLSAWRDLATAASLEAVPAQIRRSSSFPLIVVLPGLGVSRTQYTSIAQELASHGYVVVAVDPSAGGFAVDIAGQPVRTQLPVEPDSSASIAEIARQWATEADNLLDVLAAHSETTSIGRVMASVDFDAVGALGHSLGGAAAWSACRALERFRACAGLDGTLTDALNGTERLRTPTLVLQSQPTYSDADLAAAGRTREQWDELGASAQEQWRSVLAAATTDAIYRFEVPGFGHMSFGDAPFVMPSTITYFGGQTVGAMRGHEIVTSYLRAFFDRHLRDYPADLLDAIKTGS